MLNNVFLKTLRDQRRSLTWWSIGLVAYAVLILLFYPSFKDVAGLDEYLEQIPEELLALFAGEAIDYSTPEGFLNSEMFFFMVPLMFLIYAINAASNSIAGDEERGSLALLLSNPLLRWQVAAQKSAALAVATTTLGLALWVGLAGGAQIIRTEINLANLGAAVLSGVMLGLAFGALTLAISCVRGNRGMSMGVTSALAVAAYLLNALAPVVELLQPFRKLSPFYHYLAGDPVTNGLSLGNAAVLLGITVVFFGVALFAFERRDLVK